MLLNVTNLTYSSWLKDDEYNSLKALLLISSIHLERELELLNSISCCMLLLLFYHIRNSLQMVKLYVNMVSGIEEFAIQ